MDGPPTNNTMFMWVGPEDGTNKKKSESPVVRALTDAATAITFALSVKDPQESQQSIPRSSVSTSSPAKIGQTPQAIIGAEKSEKLWWS